MLYKCANPACDVPFRHLGQGKLFQIETDCVEALPSRNGGGSRKRRILRHVERYWLCDRCSGRLTLAVERGGGMITVPLPGHEKQPAVRTAVIGQIASAEETPSRAGVRLAR
jgi:hypothetical protein